METANSQPSPSDPAKLFVGGISSESSEEVLRQHFEAYGEVKEVMVMRDRNTGHCRGFAFVRFAARDAAEAALTVHKHVIRGRTVEVKRAKPKTDHGNQRNRYTNESQNQFGGAANRNGSNNVQPVVAANNNGGNNNKIFIGGLPDTITAEELSNYFNNFGTVTDAIVIYDRINRRPRGFGFVTFGLTESSEAALKNRFHQLHGKRVEVKVATPKEGNQHHTSNGNHTRVPNDYIGYQYYPAPYGGYPPYVVPMIYPDGIVKYWVQF